MPGAYEHGDDRIKCWTENTENCTIYLDQMELTFSFHEVPISISANFSMNDIQRSLDYSIDQLWIFDPQYYKQEKYSNTDYGKIEFC